MLRIMSRLLVFRLAAGDGLTNLIFYNTLPIRRTGAHPSAPWQPRLHPCPVSATQVSSSAVAHLRPAAVRRRSSLRRSLQCRQVVGHQYPLADHTRLALRLQDTRARNLNYLPAQLTTSSSSISRLRFRQGAGNRAEANGKADRPLSGGTLSPLRGVVLIMDRRHPLTDLDAI